MQTVDPKLARTITWIAAGVSIVVAITLPLGYFVLSYQSQAAALDAEAEINGRIATQVINANPDLWRFQQYKLEEFLVRRPRHGYPEVRRILDNENKVIAESADTLQAPLLTRSAELRDSGVVVGRIEISRSLWPLLLQTGAVALFGLLLGWGISVVLKVLPLRALNRALEDNFRLLARSERNLERIRALHEIDLAITSTLDARTVLDVLLEKIDLVLPYSATTVRLFNKENGLLEPVACRNLDEKEWKAEQWKAGRGTPNIVFETKSPVMVSNVQADPRAKDPEFFRKHGLVSYLGVPLIAKDEILGVISFYTKEEHVFSGEEVDFLTTLAGQAAVAIHNSQLYEEMRDLAGDLARSNRVKDEFLSVMSHELRTPLNVVMGYAGMIRDGMLGEVTPEQEQALEKVINRAKDQLTMINSILFATSLEAREVRAESHEVSLPEFLDDFRSSYEVTVNKGIRLNWDYPSDLPAVKTDGEKLRHILQNLLNNAVKFTEKGSVTVSVRIRQQAVGNRQQEEEPLTPHGSRLTPSWVEFKVADTGVGIAKEFLPVIFEKFRQVDSSETRLYGGVGIGLYIVKKFTQLLGGTVDVESELGKGTTFTVTIPCEIHQSATRNHDGDMRQAINRI